MAFIIIDNDGSVIDRSSENSVKETPADPKGQPYEMPDLQIVEVEHTPEKKPEISPWMIQDILNKIEDTREKVKKELPN